MPSPPPRRLPRRLLVGLAAALLVAGCSKDSTPPTTSTSTGTGPTTSTTTGPRSTGVDRTTTSTSGASTSTVAAGSSTTRGGNSTGEGEGNAIRKVDFANFTYPKAACGDTFPSPPEGGYALRDGAVTHGTPADADFYAVTLHHDLAFGDLTGDGNDEAVVLLDCVSGNRPIAFGWVYTLAAGGPTALAGVTLADDDLRGTGTTRGSLLDVAVAGGTLTSHWALFTSTDPICCPSQRATVTQRWDGHELRTEKVTL